MTRALLCVLLSAAVLFVGLFAAKLCSANHERGELLHRMQRANEMNAAINESLRVQTEAHLPGAFAASTRVLEPAAAIAGATQ